MSHVRAGLPRLIVQLTPVAVLLTGYLLAGDQDPKGDVCVGADAGRHQSAMPTAASPVLHDDREGSQARDELMERLLGLGDYAGLERANGNGTAPVDAEARACSPT